MALRATPTILICLTFGVAAGVGLARPASQPTSTTLVPTSSSVAQDTTGNPDSPYLVDGATPPAAAGEGTATARAEISIEDFTFSASAPVSAGSAISVKNFDSAPHTLTANDGGFDTGNLGEGESVTVTAPSTPGVYDFFCAIHPSMTGQVVVN